MSQPLSPLPIKTKVSFDIPALIAAIRKDGHFDTDASFEDLLVARNYVDRHKMGCRLSQQKLDGGGYRLTLRERADG